MHTVNRLRRNLGLLSLCLVLISTMGCNKMLAQYSQSQAQNRKAEAQKHDAIRFAPELLKQTDQAITKAAGEIGTARYAEARVSAKQAADLAKNLLNETITRRASALRDEAWGWLQIAKKNDAASIDQGKYNAIQQLNDHGRNDQYDKQKYEAAIETFLKVIGDTQSLLSNLRQDAEKGLKETQDMRKELIDEGAEQFYAESITKMDDHIKKIESFIKRDNDYRSALNERLAARQTRDKGITETRRVKSDNQLKEIEGLLATAVKLKSPDFAAQSDSKAHQDFADLLLKFDQANYVSVLKGAPDVKKEAEALIQETKVNAAKMQLANARNEITRLTDNKARIYLPGRVEQLDDLTSKAQSEFDQQLYVESRATSERALDVVKNIDAEFDAYAQNEINKASEQLGAAEATFKTMEKIFDKKIPGDWTGADRAMEDAKQGMKEELRSRLSTAGLSLTLATVRRQEKDFDVAIEVARKVSTSAEEITGETFHVVAHNSVLEIANELSRYEREGGRQYAKVELDKTHSMLDETKALIQKAQYREAVRRAADTKAQLSILYQELERVAVSRIDQASDQLKQAREKRAERYESQSLAQAMTLLDQAKGSLERGGNMQEAIEAATNAQSVANQATQESLRKWAEDMSRQSEILISRATAAGAPRFAPEKLQQAQALRKNLDDMIAQNHYEQAVEIGAQAVDAAQGALMAEVNNAEDAIASARRFNGFEYQPDRMAKAIVSLKNAREHMDSGNYQQAQVEASFALTTAQDVTAKAKRMAFADQMDSLKARLDQAGKSGAGFYQIKDMARIMAEMNQLKNNFDPKKYQDYADKVKLLEAQLAGLMESTPEALKTVTTALQERLTSLDARGARRDEEPLVRDIENKLKYAQLDFKNEKFRSSFQNVKDAQELLDSLQLRLDQRQFDSELTQYLNDFNKQIDKFGIVLNMGSTTMLKFVIGPQGRSRAVSLLNAAPPSEMRNQLTQIRASVERMNVPATRQAIHEETLRMLSLAKEAAQNFEKMLILDQYSATDASNIVQTAYMQMLKAKQAEQKIQAEVEHPRMQEKTVGVERVG
ncbi:hypothetical protein LLG95_14485 [bacterium]|nr:hypothetical protein [bacterium]